MALHIVTDGTGNLAGHMLASALTQFPHVVVSRIFHLFRNGVHDVESIIRKIHKGDLVFYAMLDERNKAVVHEACVRRMLPHFDLMGSLSKFISEHVGYLPENDVRLLHPLDEEYFHRIEAMEFTASHDDGQGLETISHADIIIVGLSRVSKSPTSTYLGAQGYKVANVSISTQTGFPKELKAKLKNRIVAFTAQPKMLQEVRARRLEQTTKKIRQLNIGDIDYYSLPAVIREVSRAEAEYRRRNYPVIDITGRTVEETSAEVLRLLGIERKGQKYT